MPPVTVIDPDTGEAHTLEGDALKLALRRGWAPETPEAASARVAQAAEAEAYGGVGEGVDAFLAAEARGLTAGGSDVALGALGGDSTKRYLRKLKEHRGVVSGAGEAVGLVGGAVAGVGAPGKVAGLAARLGRTAEGAGALAKVGRGALAGTVEGGITEMGAGISDLALSENPVTMDRIASDLSSRFIYGGALGAATGGGLRGLEVSLGAARKRLAAAGEAVAKVDDVPDEILAMDRKGLRAARDAEIEAIQAGRQPARAQIVNDVAGYRAAAKTDTPWVAVSTGEAEKTAGNRWMREIEKNYIDADRMIDRALRNPKRLAEAPEGVRAALQQQEHALEQIIAKQDELRVIHAADRSGQRAAALDAVPKALETNRALQARLADLSAAPTSAKLSAITDALDTFGDRGTKTLGGKIMSGAAYGMTASLVSSIPVVGPLAAPLVGAKVADMISGKIGAQLAHVTKSAIERTTRAVDAFMMVTRKAEPIAPIVATRVLSEVRFGRPAPKSLDEQPKKHRKRTLEDLYDERAKEISAAVMPTPEGPKIRPHVRKEIAARLQPIATMAPHVADQLESRAVRRLELLAAKMPTSTRIGMTKIRPSEMAIRAWARYVAAADDPGGIEERLASGQVTPEDAEVMRELYPDRMAEIMRQVAERMPQLRATLPYHRRLALSIFTDQPVDAAMEPRILAALQANFDQEAGTEGGTMAPQPSPAFGSVSKPSPTPAQERAG